MVVLDTCALIWWTLDPDQLSLAASKACQRMEQRGGCISSISIWEIGIKVRKGKLDLGLPLAQFVERVRRTGVIEIVPVDAAIWMANVSLSWDHRNPADRTIVAMAKLRHLPIVTSDAEIRGFYKRAIW